MYEEESYVLGGEEREDEYLWLVPYWKAPLQQILVVRATTFPVLVTTSPKLDTTLIKKKSTFFVRKKIERL